MRMTLESTDELVQLVADQGEDTVLARVWRGTNERGVDVVAIICRIGFSADDPAIVAQELSEFLPAPPPVLV